MSLVENLVNQITSDKTGGIVKPQGFDMNDTTFAKLLEKNLVQGNPEVQAGNQIAGMGAPAGFIIEPYGETAPVQPVSEDNSQIQIKDVDLGTDYFSNLLKTEPKAHKDLMNFAKKQASNVYQLFGKNLVTDLAELAGDIAGMM